MNLVERLGRPHVAQLTGWAQQRLARRTDGRLCLKEGLDGWGPPHGVEGGNADDLKVVEQNLLDGLAHLYHSPLLSNGEVHNEGRSEQNGEDAEGQQGTIGALLGAHGAIGQPFALETCATGAAEAASGISTLTSV